MTARGNGRVTKFFSSFSNLLALWLGSHRAFTIAAVLVVLGVLFVGVATKPDEEIEELRETGSSESERELSPR